MNMFGLACFGSVDQLRLASNKRLLFHAPIELKTSQYVALLEVVVTQCLIGFKTIVKEKKTLRNADIKY